MRRIIRILLVLASATVASAACSSGDDATAPTTTTSAVPSTTAAPTTTAASTTSTASPSESTITTANEEDESAALEAELLAVIRGADMVFAPGPANPDSPAIDFYYSPSFGELVRDNLAEDADGGVYFFGEFELGAVRSVSRNGERASVVACGIDAVGVEADGRVEVEPDSLAYLRVYDLVRFENRWTLDDVSFVGPEKQECDL